MNKVLFIAPVLFSINTFSQNVLVNYLGNQSQQQMQSQSVQVFASNMMVNDNNANKPARANANPQMNVQRASNANGNQRRQVRRVTNNVSTNVTNVIQPQVIFLESNTDEIQQLANLNPQVNDNLGNAFGNESLIEQIASANIPVIQLGTGSVNLNLDINMPKMKLPTIKLSSRKIVSSSKHKTYRVKNKLAKLNRKMCGKLAFGKKLKIKVDNCFKW